MSTEAFKPQQLHRNDGVRARFAFNLRRARHAAGITQEELGERSDLHRTEISLLERAGREPASARSSGWPAPSASPPAPSARA